MGFTIGVVGASGGVGASTLTAALVTRAQTILDSCGATVAVDLDSRGGLDTTLCLEHLDGLRWPDLEVLTWGSEPAEDLLLAQLPAADGVHVLAGRGEENPQWSLVADTLDALGPQSDLIALDCGARPPVPLLSRLDVLVILTRTTVKGLADLRALEAACPLGRTHAVLVSRGPRGVGNSAAAARISRLPSAMHLVDDARVVRQAERGLPPGTDRSALDAVADELLTMADTTWLNALISRVPAGRGR
ncbi:MAG TPA: hypothetical protein GXZ60_12435 [Intrasporangiaceae bacterium]|nr:hypothetical protein [Intrasporangiaceae bacterium]